MNKLQALNTWMTQKMPLLILGALALGLLFPDQIGLLCPAVSALMMFQTFANSLGSSVQDLCRVLSHPKPVLITLFSLLTASSAVPRLPATTLQRWTSCPS